MNGKFYLILDGSVFQDLSPSPKMINDGKRVTIVSFNGYSITYTNNAWVVDSSVSFLGSTTKLQPISYFVHWTVSKLSSSGIIDINSLEDQKNVNGLVGGALLLNLTPSGAENFYVAFANITNVTDSNLNCDLFVDTTELSNLLDDDENDILQSLDCSANNFVNWNLLSKDQNKLQAGSYMWLLASDPIPEDNVTGQLFITSSTPISATFRLRYDSQKKQLQFPNLFGLGKSNVLDIGSLAHISVQKWSQSIELVIHVITKLTFDADNNQLSIEAPSIITIQKYQKQHQEKEL